MIKLYFFIGTGLIITWVLTWFGVRGMYKSLDKGEESRFVKMFIPKDFEKNLADAERQSQIQQRQQERKKSAAIKTEEETAQDNSADGVEKAEE